MLQRLGSRARRGETRIALDAETIVKSVTVLLDENILPNVKPSKEGLATLATVEKVDGKVFATLPATPRDISERLVSDVIKVIEGIEEDIVVSSNAAEITDALSLLATIMCSQALFTDVRGRMLKHMANVVINERP